MKRPIQRQSYVLDKRGKRLARLITSAGLAEPLADALADAAHEMRASKRLIIAVALATFLDVPIADVIGVTDKRRRRKRQRRE